MDAFIFAAARWIHKKRMLRAVRALKQGMAPIVIALLAATGWILATSHSSSLDQWPLRLLTFVVTLLVCKTRHPML